MLMTWRAISGRLYPGEAAALEGGALHGARAGGERRAGVRGHGIHHPRRQCLVRAGHGVAAQDGIESKN